MISGWETNSEKAMRAVKISPEKKLEGIRLMNELADMVLSKKQKLVRRRLREAN